MAEKVSIAAKTKLLLSVIKSLPLVETFLRRKISNFKLHKRCYAQNVIQSSKISYKSDVLSSVACIRSPMRKMLNLNVKNIPSQKHFITFSWQENPLLDTFVSF